MRQPGFAEMKDARADGRWEAAYEPQRTASVPVELAAALVDNPVAQAAFGRLGRSEQYLLMLPMLKTYTPKTRAAALLRLISRLDR